MVNYKLTIIDPATDRPVGNLHGAVIIFIASVKINVDPFKFRWKLDGQEQTPIEKNLGDILSKMNLRKSDGSPETERRTSPRPPKTPPPDRIPLPLSRLQDPTSKKVLTTVAQTSLKSLEFYFGADCEPPVDVLLGLVDKFSVDWELVYYGFGKQYGLLSLNHLLPECVDDQVFFQETIPNGELQSGLDSSISEATFIEHNPVGPYRKFLNDHDFKI